MFQGYRPFVFAVSVVLFLSLLVFQRKEEAAFFPRLEDPAPSEKIINSTLIKSQKRYSKDSNDLRSLVDQGVAHFFLGQDHYADSLNAFNAAWQAGALDKRIFYYSGILYERLSLFDESKKQYERFLRHEPEDREIRLRLARLLFRMEKWEDATLRYQEFLAKNPEDVTSLINCGLAFQRRAEVITKKKKMSDQEKLEAQSHQKEAIRYLEQAEKIQPILPEGVPLVFAKLYFQSGNWGRVSAIAQAELNKKSDSMEFLKLLAVSNEKTAQKQQALDAYKKIVELNPREFQAKEKVRILTRQLKIK